MITKRASQERGHADHGWLDTYHTFSFARYYDPRHTGFRDLLVINEDRVKPGRGFATHSHQDMEIITYVLAGTVAHKDSMGNETRIEAGEVQRMTAGTGVTHSEFNPSSIEPLHFLQIWITPSRLNLEPSYEQRRADVGRRGGLTLIAAQDGRDDAMRIHQDVDVLAARLEPNARVAHKLRRGYAWVQLITGELNVNSIPLTPGDGAAVSEEVELQIHARAASHFLVFDLS